MSYSTMVEILKEKNKDKIVLIKTGVFYRAVGNDAVFLHQKLDLKCTCYKENVCKVGIPVNSLDKYVEKLNKINYSYIIYDYDKEKKELNVVTERIAKSVKEENKNLNCLLCKGIDAYKDDEYMKAVVKLFESEYKNEKECRK